MIGKALSYGNRSERVAVQLSNGKTVNAIAGNCINSSAVTVFKDNKGEYYAFAATPPTIVLSRRQASIRREIEEEITETLLPFQVLFTEPVNLGGDRNQISLSAFNGVTIGGVNNLGTQQYLAVWLQDQIVQDNNGAQAFLGFPAAFNTFTPGWIGNGLLSAIAIPLFPAENFTIEVTDDPLADSVEPPLYPRNLPLPLEGDVVGVTTYTQIAEGYNYLRTETYDYNVEESGDAGSPNPIGPLTFCSPFVNGQIDILDFSRDSRFDYISTISESLTGQSGVYFNNQFFASDRAETYNETFNYTVSNSNFRTQTIYRCQGNLFSWLPTGNRTANWDGQTEVTDYDYTRTINEPEWSKPLTLSLARSQKHLRTEVGTRDSTYETPVESWSVNPFDFQFPYNVVGTDTENVATTISEDRLIPTTLLISGDGNSVLFTEEIFKLKSDFVSDRIRNITKSHFLNITINENVTSHLETTNVTQTSTNSFYLSVGDSLNNVDTTNSWLLSVISDVELGVGTFTLSNDDNSPIFSGELYDITEYTEVKDLVNNTTNYSNVSSTEKPFWSTIEASLVYVQSQNFRYQGVLSSLTLVDSSVPDFSIQTIRSINSITIQLSIVSTYPQGLSEPGEFLVYPAENCSVLLRDRILNTTNKVHANLVDNLLYFSKSIIFNPTLAEQTAEVYSLGTTVVQEAPESGAFIPVNVSDTIVGTSYFSPQ